MCNYYIMVYIKKNYTFENIVLDKYQTKAVYCNNNRYLVIAGAGSGKTLTIVGKVNYLINNKNVNPKEILCISFTNESVNSLKEALIEKNISVDVKTFHKLALSFIDNNYMIASPSILNYIIDEYFYSYIYFDNCSKLFDYYLDENQQNKENFILYFKNIIYMFINSFKNYNYDISFFLKIILKCRDNSDKILLILIFKIYILYQEELKSQNLIDFNDIINKAIEKIDNLKYFRYKYLIIDEYQDTSYSKCIFVKKIIAKFNVNLMAVGDDFQSIYSFTGCNIKMFLDFKKNFKKSKIIKLKNTYRNPKDIVDISRKFILKNKDQLRKTLSSNKYIKDSILIVYSKNIPYDVSRIIKEKDDILILGRNNSDVNLLVDNKNFSIIDNKLIYLRNKNKNIRFLTVHASKGLESDIVIVLNVIDSNLGFPNKIIEYKLFNYINPFKKSKFPYAEERRIFYVALTRTKSQIFLFTNKKNPSIFIKELIKNYNWKIKKIDFE